ncbi:lipopolysaccharide assembly protein LapA domain-containing protein [Fortiea contorta]|uniref:lipopolysaccharide assembly protein LapA domain-containing protein n=1 Tax=Fortiea contorta TaxID=1892405 RepID=UPI000345CAC8|nr:lipopolysaccharide assembly protein LapA domain-containing protein [Fortiea contorta]
MKSIVNLLISVIVAVWVVAIAIISAQNAEPISLRFFAYQSIKIPFGLVLAFSAGVGLIGIAVLQPLWRLGNSPQDARLDEDAEFFVDDEDF